MSIQIREIVSAFPNLLSLSRGPETASVDDVQTGSTAGARSLIFAATEAQVRAAADSPAVAVVVRPDQAAGAPERLTTVLTSPHPQLAMAKVAKRFFPQTRGLEVIAGARIHEGAWVSDRARLGRDCVIGPGVVIGDDCVLGDRCVVGANSVLEPGVKIGEGTRIHPLVFIGHGCEFGRNCEVHPNTSIGMEGFGYAQDAEFNHHRLTHYGRVIVEDDVHIGAGVQIDRGTFEDSVIGSGTKIDNHCHFGHNIRIGRKNLITAAMITAGSTTIGDANVFGGRATIKGHLKVGNRIHVAGISSIGKDITEPGEYGGHPLQPLRDEMRTRASLKKLPQLVRQVRQILKHLGLEGGVE